MSLTPEKLWQRRYESGVFDNTYFSHPPRLSRELLNDDHGWLFPLGMLAAVVCVLLILL